MVLPEATHNEDNHVIVGLLGPPLIGTLNWISGMGGDDHDNLQKIDTTTTSQVASENATVELDLALQNMMIEEIEEDEEDNMWQPVNSCTNATDATESRCPAYTKVSLPPLVSSDVSVSVHAAEDNNNKAPEASLAKSKKKMSWSDNLVEYMNDEVRTALEWVRTIPHDGIFSRFRSRVWLVVFARHVVKDGSS